MKRFFLLVSLAAFSVAAVAQTSPKPSTPGSSSASATAASGKATTTATASPWVKLPPGVPHVVHGPLRTALTLHYEDIKVGTGPEGESGKLWHVKYTGWRAADGVKFDSWDDHKRPVFGKDGKPELGPDGKPMMGDPEPLVFPQGIGRLIPGFDYAVEGMRIGGKRRIFIPWQLAYGTRTIPDRPDHPGIPSKSDLIFDVELVDVTDMPAPPPRPVMPNMPPHPGVVPHPGAPAAPGAAPGANPGAAPGAPAAPASPSATPKPAAPAAPTTPTTPPPATSQPQSNSSQPQSNSSQPQPNTTQPQ
jgi:peptidylprolyl isomerase